MLTHVHIHAMMTAGGISIPSENTNNPTWIPIAPDSESIQKEALARLFKKKFLRGVKILFDQGKLEVPSELELEGVHDRQSLHEWLKPLAAIDWNTNAQITPNDLKTQLGCARYLSDYIQGTAISDSRILDDDGKQVTVLLWDYRTDKPLLETMPGEEFVRRFLLHIVPSNVHRVRYAGLFQGKGRNETLQRLRLLLAKYNADCSVAGNESHNKPTLLKELDTPKINNRPKCQRCGTPGMRFEGYRDRTKTWEFIDRVRNAIEQYAKVPTTLDQLIQSATRLRGLAPRQGWLADWKRAVAVQGLLAWTVVECGIAQDRTEAAWERYGATRCSVSMSLPLPDT